MPASASEPGNASLAVYSDDVSATCREFQKIAIGKALCGPDFAPLLKELDRLGWASPLHLRPAFGFDWVDLAAVHDGGGLVIFPLADGEPGAAWIFVSSTPIETTPAIIAAATAFHEARLSRGNRTAPRSDADRADAQRQEGLAASAYSRALDCTGPRVRQRPPRPC